MSIGAKSVSRFLHSTLWGWRHLVNNLHTVAKMAAASSATVHSKNREKDSALVPPILIKTTHKQTEQQLTL